MLDHLPVSAPTPIRPTVAPHPTIPDDETIEPAPITSNAHFIPLVPSSVCYGAGRGGFSLCDPAVTPARGQLFAVPPRPV